MYDELIKRLRNCSTQAAPCKTCDLTEDGSCSDTLMKQAADAIEELQAAVPKWISVEERLPEDGEFALVCNDDGHMMIAKYEAEVYGWYYKYTNYDFDIWDNEEQGPVLWWMPLPAPPKEDDDGD